MTLALYAGVYVALATAGLILLRRSLADAPLDELVRDPSFLLGAACYAASFTTFLLSLRRFEVLVVFPVFTGVAYATVAVGAWWILDESLDVGRLAGIVLIGAGVVLVVR